MKNDCIFCAIAAGEIPSFKVYEDDVALAYLDINPFAKGHTLVIPKAHSEGLLDASDETLAALVALLFGVRRNGVDISGGKVGAQLRRGRPDGNLHEA